MNSKEIINIVLLVFLILIVIFLVFRVQFLSNIIIGTPANTVTPAAANQVS